MSFVILTQKNRKVEEIQYDHEIEKVRESILTAFWKGQVRYRRREKINRKIWITVFALINMALATWSYMFVTLNLLNQFIFLGINIFVLLIINRAFL